VRVSFGRCPLHFENEIATGSEIPSLNCDREAFLLKDVGDPFGPSLIGRRIAYEERRHPLIHIAAPRLGVGALYRYQFGLLSIHTLIRRSRCRLRGGGSSHRPNPHDVRSALAMVRVPPPTSASSMERFWCGALAGLGAA